MSDSEIQRIALTELEQYAQKLAARGDVKTADDAMVLVQLVASLRANSERDLIVAQMASRFDQLEKAFVNECEIHSIAYKALVSEFNELQRQQDELRKNQERITAIVDAGIMKISEAVRKIENMSASVKDLTEP